MDLFQFCRELPKVELHAHLNGSLSKSTMLLLKRLNADSGIKDETNTFMDEFVMGAGDTRSLSENPENLIISRLIISINRTMVTAECDAITDLAIEYHKKYPDIVVGIELSGNPIVGEFQNFLPALTRARDAGLKVSLHCGEVRNPKEVLDMINFKPERLGHGVCIHPKFGGTQETWQALCNSLIPVELCLTSNVNTKSVSGYESHHFKELYEAGIPVIINTDDKGVFATSLSQEYMLCAETFHLEKEQIARLALSACQYIFDTECRDTVKTKVLEFMNKHYICSY
ncbi:uncharacterized protein Ada isoform X4 [Plodia interpunctella]|uniref:uncharacterized protein Ada isoform X4 n=1 Tax=Plodia interpunctella TaxID=58824 RepID=UPI002368E58E|nr:uncharacterized protein LOC128669150 isoform X4 [Plodia interpunctella]